MTDTKTPYAIINAGGSQYRVREGAELTLFRVSGKEAGDRIEFAEVLLTRQDERVLIGTPTVAGGRVEGIVLDHHQGPKIRVATYRAKSRYRRVKGHRDQLTRVKIERIVTGNE